MIDTHTDKEDGYIDMPAGEFSIGIHEK